MRGQEHWDLLKQGNDFSPADSKYHLTAVVEHVGQSYDCGHYVAYVKSDFGWIKCNDEKMSLVSDSTTLGENAYLLFYKKCSQ